MRPSRLLFACLALVPLCLASSSAHAYPYYVNTRYGLPELPASYTSYECTDCHVHPGGGGSCNASGGDPLIPCFNPFGIAYRVDGWSNALRDMDADADGRTNGAELGMLGSAGMHFQAEAVGCDMLTCATNTGSSIDCASNNVRCTASHGASPTHNYDFSYSCAPGTAGVTSGTGAWGCTNVNECAGDPCGVGTCTERPLSSWSSPGYTCACPAGYGSNGTTCVVTDDCLANTDDCVAAASCSDTPGAGSFTCTCPAGYGGDGRASGTGCFDVNECTSHPCAPHGAGGADGQGCSEIPIGSWSSPGYTCACEPGYGSNGTTCVLENECTAGTDDCAAVATCTDPSSSSGDFTCACPAGYVGDGRVSGSGCTDVNECAAGMDDCHANATCTNTPGGFTCACDSGYTGDGRTSCADVDECADPIFLAMCDPNASCNNLVGSFECVCDAGYRGDGSSCADIDECAEASDDCGATATCTNVPGGFECECPAGYEGDGTTCTDVDECLDPANSGLCSSVATCNNLVGSWECVCGPGFEGDGFTCADVDECADPALNECDPNATCANENGGYACACDAGYAGSGVDCADVDECALGTHGCDLNEVCVNQPGMPNLCECAPGTTRASADDPCLVTCGDGLRGAGEACDDGNAADGDGCDARCAVEPGWACYEPTEGASTCTETCGDGLVDEAEECDEGSANSDTAPDGCRTTCRRAFCGDAVLDGGEECDEGEANSDEAVDGCRSTCEPAYCGDGVVDSGESCDPGGGVEQAEGACTHQCAPDAGIDPADPPALTGGAGCAASGRGTPAPWLALLGLGLLLRRRRV